METTFQIREKLAAMPVGDDIFIEDESKFRVPQIVSKYGLEEWKKFRTRRREVSGRIGFMIWRWE